MRDNEGLRAVTTIVLEAPLNLVWSHSRSVYKLLELLYGMFVAKVEPRTLIIWLGMTQRRAKVDKTE